MINIASQELYGVEFDPLYGEIESTLAQLDTPGDPLLGPDVSLQINWNQVAEQAEKLLAQCYDLRVALWLMRARMHQEGISAFWHGITELNQRISSESDSVYPRSTDDNKYSEYAAALGWLSTAQCVAEIKTARLTKEHNYRLQDVINNDISSAAERTFTSSSAILLTINAWYQQYGLPDINQQLTAVSKSLDDVENIANQYSTGYQLDCRSLHNFLNRVVQQVNQLIVSTAAPSEISIEPTELTVEQYAQGLPDNADLNIRSRQEVILMLEKILDYFQRHEPSHPAPILIRRCKQMIGMDFISIVEELLPDAITTLQQFTGK